MQQQAALYDMTVAAAAGQAAYGYPSAQQQLNGRISNDGSDTQMMAMSGHESSQSNPTALLGRKHAPNRRPHSFWQPLNDWWRSQLTRLGRKPTSEEIGAWYMEAADRTWGDTKPILQETRVHAMRLQSKSAIRDYFRKYRAKRKGKGSDGSGYDREDTGDGDTEDGTDTGDRDTEDGTDTGDGDTEDGTNNRGPSRSKQQPKPAGAGGPPKRARLAGPANSNSEAADPAQEVGAGAPPPQRVSTRARRVRTFGTDFLEYSAADFVEHSDTEGAAAPATPATAAVTAMPSTFSAGATASWGLA